VPYLLYGALRARAGTLAGPDGMVELRAMTPPRALERGLVLIPADRKTAGSVPSLSVADNLTLPVLDRFSTAYGRLRLRPMAEHAGRELVDHDVRPRDPSLPYGTLSGGNQQKVMLAKWLQLGPRLMLLHEPTQGVDIGARAQIFDVLREIAREGTTILVASSDYEQLAAVCDRVLVCAGGAVSQQLRGEGVAKERIAEQVYNSTTTEGSQRWSA
jgi:ribose transport system ATP-binding protein